MTDRNLRNHFHTVFHEALKLNQSNVSEFVKIYVTDMLVQFMDANGMSEKGLPTLTWLYRDALIAQGAQRTLALKRLGDVTLFLSGVFNDYVKKTSNGVGYYVDMGRNAYACAGATNPIFKELSNNFIPLVAVLNSFSHASSLSRNLDVDSLLDLYVRDTTNLVIKHRLEQECSIPIIISAPGLS